MQYILIGFYFNTFLFVYNYIKLLSHNLPRRNSSKIWLSLYILFMPILSYIIRLNIPYIHIPIIIISLVLLFKYIYHDNFLVILNFVLFALGATYVFSLIGKFVTALIIFPIFLDYWYNLFVLGIITSIIQLIINLCTFRLKRLKNGLSFLKKDQNSTLGTIISVSIIILTMFLSNSDTDPIYIVPVVSIFLIVTLFYSWNKFKFKQHYNNMTSKRELAFLKNEIAKLSDEKETLARLIHKDNKMIPAMETSVINYLNSNGNKALAKELIKELENLISERKEILYKSSSTVLYQTGIVATDSLLNYYSAKCATSNIEFTCILSGNLSDSLDKKISATDFNSILADLIENAFIATKCNQGHHIHVVISAINPTIDVYDSGAPFDIKVLANLGLKRITTHKGTGSGIGLTSIYEFTSKYNARLTIDETAQIDSRFTKKVSISFNTEKEYKLITSRTKEEIKYLYRREDIKIEQPA